MASLPAPQDSLRISFLAEEVLSYPYQPTPSKPQDDPLPFGTGSILSVKSLGIDLYCSVDCSPEDWDCEGVLTCDNKASGSLDDGFMISGSDFMTRDIHSGDQVTLKSQGTSKFCAPSDPSTDSVISCDERHYDDDAAFVIEKVDLHKAVSLGYPTGGGGDEGVKTVVRIRPADSPHSWCHPFKAKKSYEIRCGGHFDKGMDLFEVSDVGGGGGSWAPPSGEGGGKDTE